MTSLHQLSEAELCNEEGSFPLLFIDQILDCLAWQIYFYYLDRYLAYNQIPIHLDDQEKMTFTCPFDTFTFRRMPFGLCNALMTFKRCMTTVFSDFLDDSLEVFMDDFSIFGNDFGNCLAHLTKILEVCIRKDWYWVGWILLYGVRGSSARASRLKQMTRGG